MMPRPTSPSTLAAGTWEADPTHSDISFKARHIGVGKVRGAFDLASATLDVGDDGVPSGRVRAVVDAASVLTNNEQRNDHLRSTDGAGNVVIGDAIEIAIEIEFTAGAAVR